MKNRFEVFSLDVYMDEAGCWTENSRTSLGELAVEPAVGSEIDAVDIIAALKRFGYSDLTVAKSRPWSRRIAAWCMPRTTTEMAPGGRSAL